MELSEIGESLLRARRTNKDSLLTYYAENFLTISKAVSAHKGLKSRLFLRTYDDDYFDKLRLSALMNDLTLLTLPRGSEMMLHIPGPNKNAFDFIGSDLRFNIQTTTPDKYFDESGQAKVIPAFAICSDSIAQQTIDSIAPQLSKGRMLVEAERCIIAPEHLAPDGTRHWTMVNVDPDSPIDVWQAKDYPDNIQTTPILIGAQPSNTEVNLYNVTIPYLSGTSFHDLASILDSEEHHIAKARVALQKVVEEARAAGEGLQTIINDILRPELDSLTAKLTSLSQAQLIKQGAAILGVATMGLTAYFTGGIPQAAAAIAGAGGVGLLAKETAEGREKWAAISESPFYLIWRLRKLQRSRH